MPRCPLAAGRGPTTWGQRPWGSFLEKGQCRLPAWPEFRVQGPAGAVGSVGSLQLIPWLQLLFMLLSGLELQSPRRS